MLDSRCTALCHVTLPWNGRQKYMHTFDLAAPLMPPEFGDYLGPVKALCRAAGATSGVAHMTVDEKIVQTGKSQRRPKPHVDGCFMPALMSWGQGPSWAHGCNNISASPFRRMSVIVVASVPGCRVWSGLFVGEPASDGDLSHIADQLGNGEVLPANVGYLLSPDCVHESMIFDRAVQRTFLRIALPLA